MESNKAHRISNGAENNTLLKSKVLVININRSEELELKIKKEHSYSRNICSQFNKSVDRILKLNDSTDTGDVNSLSLKIVEKLFMEATKLQNHEKVTGIASEKIVKLFKSLEANISEAAAISLKIEEDNGAALERVMVAAEASLTSLCILTSQNIPKVKNTESLIENIILFVKFQTLNSLYPDFECPVYSKKKTKDDQQTKPMQLLHQKICNIVTLLSNLLDVEVLSDSFILHASSLAISIFLVENTNEVQLIFLKLITMIFTKYQKHRVLILNEIFSTISRLPSTRRNLRIYKLNGKNNIQKITALILTLIQSVAVLPEKVNESSNVDQDVLIVNKNREVVGTAVNFLHAFLIKSGNKNESIDFRPIFEGFLQDLFATLNKPEWPVCELMLFLLAKLLMDNFSNKLIDINMRLASLEYFGLLAAKSRRNSAFLQANLGIVEEIIKFVRSLGKDVTNQEEQINLMQSILLNFLENYVLVAETNNNYYTARHFYVLQFYKECMKKNKALTSVETKSQKKTKLQLDTLKNNLLDIRKKLLLSKIPVNLETKGKINEISIDYNGAEVVAQYLLSKGDFALSFDNYLGAIIKILKDSSIAIRSKAMKCLSLIVEADPSILGQSSVQLMVQCCFLDHAASVREAAVDLVGKFLVNQPELVDKYYRILLARVLDTSISVRKRVITIFKRVCEEFPEYINIPELCFKIMHRVNDVDSIRLQVLEIFENLWFTPTFNQTILLGKVTTLTNFVALCFNNGMEKFDKLLVYIFKPKEGEKDSENALLAGSQIVDCLMKQITSNNNIIQSLRALHVLAKICPKLLLKHSSTLQTHLSLETANSVIVLWVAKMFELIVPFMEDQSDSFLGELENSILKLIIHCNQNVISTCVSCLAAIVLKTNYLDPIKNLFANYYLFLGKFKTFLENPVVFKHNLADIKCRQYFRRSLFTAALLLHYFDFKDTEVAGNTFADVKDEIYQMFAYFLQHQDKDVQANALKTFGYICSKHYEFMLKHELKVYYQSILTTENYHPNMKIYVLNNIELYLTEEERRMTNEDLKWSTRSKTEDLKEMCDVSSGMASTIIQVYLKQILSSYLHINTMVRTCAVKVIQLIIHQGLVNPIPIIPYLICMSTDYEEIISRTGDKLLQDIEKKNPGFIHTKSVFGLRLSFELQNIMKNKEGIFRGFKWKKPADNPCSLNAYLYTLLRKSKSQRRKLVLNILKQFEDQAHQLSYLLYLSDNLAYFPYELLEEVLFIIHHIDVMITFNGTNLLENFREGLVTSKTQELTSVTNGECENLVVAIDEEDEDKLVLAIDEEEDEESLIKRLPEDVSKLKACIEAVQGCFLLLQLKQFLKSAYSLSDSKIHKYSPTDSLKDNDKKVNRKTKLCFNPKAVNKLIEESTGIKTSSEGRRYLVKEYLDFKKLMLKFDPTEVNDEVKNNNVRPSQAKQPKQSCSKNVSVLKATTSNEKDITQPTKKIRLSNINEKTLDNMRCSIRQKLSKTPVNKRNNNEPKKM